MQYSDEVKKEIHRLIHFYFSLLVAIKIERRNGGLKKCEQLNIFVLRWLKNTRKRNPFGRKVLLEMDWLANYIKSQGESFSHAERFIETIHEKSMQFLQEGVK